MGKFVIALAVVLIPVAVSAQTQTQTLRRPAIDDPSTAAMQSTRDPPRGFPYRTGDYSSGENATAQVPLRDFLSSRQDQQRAELLRLIENLETWLQRVQDERDRQYQQQFNSLQAASEAALASAKEAVLKAEKADSDRFENVNEWRRTVDDLAETFARTFMSKDEANPRFKAIEEKLDSVYDRLNAMQSQGQGRTDAWELVLIIGSMAIAAISLMYTALNRQRQSEQPSPRV